MSRPAWLLWCEDGQPHWEAARAHLQTLDLDWVESLPGALQRLLGLEEVGYQLQQEDVAGAQAALEWSRARWLEGLDRLQAWFGEAPIPYRGLGRQTINGATVIYGAHADIWQGWVTTIATAAVTGALDAAHVRTSGIDWLED